MCIEWLNTKCGQLGESCPVRLVESCPVRLVLLACKRADSVGDCAWKEDAERTVRSNEDDARVPVGWMGAVVWMGLLLRAESEQRIRTRAHAMHFETIYNHSVHTLFIIHLVKRDLLELPAPI